MARVVKGPDGAIHQFPDDATDEEIKTALGGDTPPPVHVAPTSGWGQTIGDVALGALKGAGQTATNLGRMVQKIPGVTTAVDALYGTPGLSEHAMTAADGVLAPTNTAQKVGKIGEQIGEVVLPGKAIAAAGAGLPLLTRVGLEAAGGAGMSAAQGGNPIVGGIAGGVLPILGAGIRAAAPKLAEAAETQVVKALGPTKERFKAMAERISPEILKRGLRGSREALQEQAAETASEVGGQIDDAIQAYGARTVDTTPVTAALDKAKSAFQTIGPDGKAVIFEPRAVRQLDGLKSIVESLGPDARVDQLVAVRRAWDKVVDQAGGFAHRAGGAIGVPLKDQSEAFAKREATGAIRNLLDAEVPELGALNKEYSFWKSLDGVLTQTLQRTQPQGPSLLKAGAEIVGGAAGATHGPVASVTGAYALGKVSQMFRSARWQLASAQAKDRLATAIVDNDAGEIATALSRIGGTEGSKVVGAQ